MGNRRLLFGTGAVVAMLVWTACGRAGVVAADSLEWMVADADLIARCRLVEIPDFPSDDPSAAVVFSIRETLKGPPLQRVTVSLTQREIRALIDWWKKGDERVVFFNRTDHLSRFYFGSDIPRLQEYPYCLRREWQFRRSRNPPVDEPIAITIDHGLLRDPKEIESALAAALAFQGSPTVPQRQIIDPFWYARFATIPPGAPPHLRIEAWSRAVLLELQSGSLASVDVPLDSRIEQLAQQWAARQKVSAAVEVLRFFKSAQNTEILINALSDPTFLRTDDDGLGATWRYPVRQTAYQGLENWGLNVARPQINLPADGYFVITFTSLIVGSILFIGTFIALLSMVRRLRRRAIPPRTGIVGALLDTGALILGATALLIISFNWEGGRVAREITWTRNHTQYWIWLFDGGVCASRGTLRSKVQPLAVGTFDAANAPFERWDLLYHYINMDWHGFLVRDFNGGGGRTGTAIWSYDTVRAPTIAVISALACIPFLLLSWRTCQTLFFRRRRRRGLCMACGYDLRGGHERCPECGNPVPSA